MEPQVVKRDGRRENVSFDKVQRRIHSLSRGLNVDTIRVTKRVIQGVHDGVLTTDLDVLAAETAAALAAVHPDYSSLAARVSVSNLHKMTEGSIGAVFPHLSDEVRNFCATNLATLDGALVWERDFRYDYFGIKTLERSYLLRDGEGRIVERPQVLLLRVAAGIHCGDVQRTLQTYALLSEGLFTHATPTMFNCGTRNPHLASCFLLPVEEDSISGIFRTLSKTAEISKSAGGIGFSVSNVRAKGSLIKSTGGRSAGLLPMLRCFETTARYVDQGGGKRKGAFCAYLEPWHRDVFAFLDMKKNHGAEELRARDLFYALWIPDLFMERVEGEKEWTLFSPEEAPLLQDSWGGSFNKEYERLEAAGIGQRIQAQKLWFAILDAQVETGTPFMLYKDACNAKSNHQHLGTIRSSNLCTEIVQYSSPDEIAVCNLASLSLPRFVGGGVFNHEILHDVVGVVVENLNLIIDRNAYAREEGKTSNLLHRPVGIGVQGLADVFASLGFPFEGERARRLNFEIFETIYFSSLSRSCALAERDGAYPSYPGSPASRGLLQFDLWGRSDEVTDRWDWAHLRERIRAHGLRNSLLVAPMPTASTAQILGNNEAFEPFTSNVYVRRVLAGEFVNVNRHLVSHLEERGLWTEEVRTSLLAGNGSVQHIPSLSDETKELFKTAWEMKMKSVLDMAADRAIFVDQSQSLNLFVSDPTHSKLSSMHFYGWRKGLKTGMYYLRTRPAVEAVKVALPVEACRSREECLACSA